MILLKQSTAVTIKFGPFLDETDGKTAEVSLTLSQADFRLSKNGGDFAQKNEASSATHDEIGYYDVALDTTDTNTLGRLLVAVHESGALPVWMYFMVVPANVYDSIVGGSDKLQVHTDEITNGLIVAATLGADCITNAKIADDAIAAENIAANAISAAKIATDALAAIADKLLGRQADASDGDRNLGRLIRKGVNKVSISGTTLTVTEEDDTTPAFTETIARSAVDALISSDPD